MTPPGLPRPDFSHLEAQDIGQQFNTLSVEEARERDKVAFNGPSNGATQAPFFHTEPLKVQKGLPAKIPPPQAQPFKRLKNSKE